MELFINPSHTLYSIYLEVTGEQTIKVGKLGTFTFKEGTYIYVGVRNVILLHE